MTFFLVSIITHALEKQIRESYEKFEVPYNPGDYKNYPNGEGFCCGNTREISTFEGGIGLGNVEYEKMQYYYHSDHLGSSSYITNLDGEVVQHIEYMPYGEVFIEERNNSWSTPYLFNAKELDQESGLYYFGARYYDPKVGMFLSVDPLLDRTLDAYGFGNQNPVRFVDPTGMSGEDPGDPPSGKSEITLDPIMIIAKPKSWFDRNIWKPMTRFFRNTGSRIIEINNNNYITTTQTAIAKYNVISENKFFSASVHTSTTHGNSGILNVDNKITITDSKLSQEYSQDYQIDLSIVKGNFEVTKESMGIGVGASFFGQADIGIGITLNADILNSEISFNGNENINRDSSSNGFSIGIKPVSMIISGIGYALSRLVPNIVLDPAIYSPILGPQQNNKNIY